ncbi:MAG: type II toxin-antitoxin system RelE/ParE family toxin [Betaproteobacteria bacterium]|nr:type II toxin-antitoxin system RelE/ParE family toxin [Betaproteobacteria bacterium]
MYTIHPLPEFTAWLSSIKDGMTKRRLVRRLVRRLEKAGKGNLGDVEPVGEGVSEMREFFGPGWRMYYVQRGDKLIVMLGGGDKSTQGADIKAAKELAKTLED